MNSLSKRKLAKPVEETWIDNDADRRAVAEGCVFDLAAAERVRDFLRRFCRHSKGEWANKPFELLDWQWRRIVGPLFGWRRPDGTRRFRRAYIEIPKKNGKSALCSALALYLLMADREPGAEVYTAAADRDQATIVFGEAANMVEASPALSSRLQVIRSTKRVIFAKERAFLRALSADVPTKEGLNIHGLIFDELHTQKTRDLWDTLTYGGAARRQPLLVAVTTAGVDRHSICYQQHVYAKQVLEGSVPDTSYFAFIAAANADDDWTAEAVWRKANPGLGIIKTLDGMAKDCEEAKAMPQQENAFRRYHLNQWLQQVTRWIPMDRWRRDDGPVDITSLAGRDCWAGLDLSSTIDLTALVLVFPDDAGGFDVLPFFWAPEETALQRIRRDRVPYDVWAREGHLEYTPGDAVDYDYVREALRRLADTYHVRGVAIDRWNAAQLSQQLVADGLNVVGFGQGFASMGAPSKEFQKLVLAGKLRHGDNPVLSWCVGNAAVEQDAAGNIKPSKRKSTERIDGVVALIMALGLAASDPDNAGESIYEQQGVRSL